MKNLIDRIGGWRTSVIGLTGSAVAVYLFTSLGCNWPSWQEWFAVILPGVVGLLTKDHA